MIFVVFYLCFILIFNYLDNVLAAYENKAKISLSGSRAKQSSVLRIKSRPGLAHKADWSPRAASLVRYQAPWPFARSTPEPRGGSKSFSHLARLVNESLTPQLKASNPLSPSALINHITRSPCPPHSPQSHASISPRRARDAPRCPRIPRRRIGFPPGITRRASPLAPQVSSSILSALRMWTLLRARSMGDVLRYRSRIDAESEWMMAAGNAVFAALVFVICQRRWGLTFA